MEASLAFAFFEISGWLQTPNSKLEGRTPQEYLKKTSLEELVLNFTDICLRQDEAEFHEQISKYNRLYQQMAAIVDELKSRAPDARSALVSLYDHPNVQLRLQAATLSLAVASVEARHVIEAIAQSSRMPQAGDAGMTLRALDEGIFKPT